MSYRVVLFDLDHTLLDSDTSHATAFTRTMDHIGVIDTDEVYPIFDRINSALWRRVEGGEVSPNEVKTLRFRRLLDELGIDGDPVEMGMVFALGLTETGELYEGAAEVLATLSTTHRLAMVTNGIGPVQRGRLDRLGIAECFEVVTISGEAGVAKPGREIFDITFAALGVDDRDAAVMVGDNVGSDILGGHNAGIDTIWFNPSGVPADPDIVATHTVAALDELAILL